MKKTLLLLAGCMLFFSAGAQRQSSFVDEPRYVDETDISTTGTSISGSTGKSAQQRSSHYDYDSNSTFLPDDMYKQDLEQQYSRTGHRLDIDLTAGVGSIRIKPTHHNESYFKVGIAGTGYLVFPGKKNAVGLTLDFSYDHLFNKVVYSYNLLAGPAYSHNFTPFSNTHLCLDVAAGYLLRVHNIASNVYIPELKEIDKIDQHTIGIRAGISAFTWIGDSPMEYRLNFYMPLGSSTLMSGSDKDKIDSAFGGSWTIALSLGVRLGKY